MIGKESRTSAILALVLSLPVSVLATQELGDASAGGGRKIRGKRIYDLLLFRNGISRNWDIHNQIRRHRKLDVLRTDQRIRCNLPVIKSDSPASPLSISVTDRQLYVSVVFLKDTGVRAAADPGQRICHRVDRNRLS